MSSLTSPFLLIGESPGWLNGRRNSLHASRCTVEASRNRGAHWQCQQQYYTYWIWTGASGRNLSCRAGPHGGATLSESWDVACAVTGSVIEKDKEVCFRRWPISSVRASGKQKGEATRHRSAKVWKISTRLNEGGWGAARLRK